MEAAFSNISIGIPHVSLYINYAGTIFYQHCSMYQNSNSLWKYYKIITGYYADFVISDISINVSVFYLHLYKIMVR
jgi:hypothetical protein